MQKCTIEINMINATKGMPTSLSNEQNMHWFKPFSICLVSTNMPKVKLIIIEQAMSMCI